MNVTRFLSRKDRRSDSTNGLDEEEQAQEDALQSQSWKIFSLAQSETSSKANFTERVQIGALRKTLNEANILAPGDRQLRWALRSKYADGDTQKAFELLCKIQTSMDGIITTYQPDTKLVGAENRSKVTCYLDSLLFAMFARVGFFDALLYPMSDDGPRRNLLVILRLWVNMLRSGMLIPEDVAKILQEVLSECGWFDAARLRQQDASEAFSFIADKLDLPLVTLKMDIFHNGKEDVGNDHRFVNERLLMVSIPPDREDDKPILLEDCLESYFTDRIDVTRRLVRRNTFDLVVSSSSIEKGAAIQTEIYEVNAGSPSPSETDLASRTRTSSIVRTRFIPGSEGTVRDDKSEQSTECDAMSPGGGYRKEVMIPAWQILSCIPWYTRNTEAFETAVHFSSQRPILGICLKRYDMVDGKAVRRDTKIDVPIDIALPHFVKDDSLTDDAPLYGKFKLSLQSAVCHQGKSVNGGHYISLVRASPSVRRLVPGSGGLLDGNSELESRYWMRFDDLAKERITLVDIENALSVETPYILFYQIVPLDESTDDSALPPYEDSGTATGSSPGSDLVKLASEVTECLPDDKSEDGLAKNGRRISSSNRLHGITSASEDRRPSHGSQSFMKGLPRPRSSQRPDGILGSALSHLPRRKSAEDKVAVGTNSNHRDSLDLPKSQQKGGSAKRLSTVSHESDEARRPNLRRLSTQLPPKRECVVM